MISLHTIFAVSLVSQATTALVLALLAYSETRIRGLRALAVACGLHSVAIFVMPMWREKNLWVPEAISAALLPLIFFLIHEGLRSLFEEQKSPSHSQRVSVAAVTLLGTTMLLVVVVAPWSKLWSMQIAFCAGVVLMARTVWMLWQIKRGSTRTSALVMAGLLAAILLTMLARIPLEPHVPQLPLLLSLRKLTVVEITLLAFSFLAVYQAQSRRLLHEETRRDALTGLPNRRAVEERAAAETHLSEQTGRPLALLMMDLDGFKGLNDTWGHPFGDYALRRVGDVLLREAKAESSVARLSGEEFAMLLPGHTLEDACRIAELLRAAIADLVLAQGEHRVHLTVSIGVAVRHAGESTWTEMLRRADVALYRAKLGGRNRVMACEEAVGRVNPRFQDAHTHTSQEREWRSRPVGNELGEDSPSTE